MFGSIFVKIWKTPIRVEIFLFFVSVLFFSGKTIFLQIHTFPLLSPFFSSLPISKNVSDENIKSEMFKSENVFSEKNKTETKNKNISTLIGVFQILTNIDPNNNFDERFHTNEILNEIAQAITSSLLIFFSNKKDEFVSTETVDSEFFNHMEKKNFEHIEKLQEKCEIWKSVLENAYVLLTSASCVGDLSFQEAVRLANNSTYLMENENDNIDHSKKVVNKNTYINKNKNDNNGKNNDNLMTEKERIRRIGLSLEDDDITADRNQALSLMKCILTLSKNFHYLMIENSTKTVNVIIYHLFTDFFLYQIIIVFTIIIIFIFVYICIFIHHLFRMIDIIIFILHEVRTIVC